MKYPTSIAYLIVIVLATACGSKSAHDEQEHGSAVTNGNPNDALYEEVMKIHDEVMPKMETMYNLQKELEKQLADTPDMVEEKRKEIEAQIENLKKAGEGMSTWMHEFNPPADSLGEEVVREYLEGQMEKVKKVKEDIVQALEKKD